MKSDPKYFARRCSDEWAAARSAVGTVAQARHVDLAIRYEELALRAGVRFAAPPPDFYDD
jgi:hypothetical protein